MKLRVHKCSKVTEPDFSWKICPTFCGKRGQKFICINTRLSAQMHAFKRFFRRSACKFGEGVDFSGKISFPHFCRKKGWKIVFWILKKILSLLFAINCVNLKVHNVEITCGVPQGSVLGPLPYIAQKLNFQKSLWWIFRNYWVHHLVKFQVNRTIFRIGKLTNMNQSRK